MGRLAGRWAPVWVGLLSVALGWWVWGDWSPMPVIQDEAAYLLQARIFAGGRWTSPPPPMPEPFEQYHVLVRPVLAAKYDPGQAFVLTPGVRLGWAPFGPLLVIGLTGALVFGFARSLAGSGVALLTTWLWLTGPINLRFGSSYLSEITTALLWVASFYALHRWTQGAGRGWLAVISLLVSACVITRPLAGLVLAVVVAGVVLLRIGRVGTPRDLVLPLVLSLSVPAVLGFWAWKATGDAWESPRSLYTHQYMPWDRLGFGLDATPPTMPLSADFERFAAEFRSAHAAHTPAQLPVTLLKRSLALVVGAFGGGAVILAICLAVGVTLRREEAKAPLAAVSLLLLAHLSYAQPTVWVPYYLETQPLLAFYASVGALELCRWSPTTPGGRLRRAFSVASRPLVFLCVAAGVLILPRGRRHHRVNEVPSRQFRDALGALDGRRAIVFVRYSPTHQPFQSLITNAPEPDSAPVWVALELGPAVDRALLARADGREPWLFEQCTGRLVRWDPPAPERTASDSAAETSCSRPPS